MCNLLNMVRDMYKKIKYWHPEADHVIMATNYGGELQSCDDSESMAGLKLENLLELRKESNVVVFVVREYGNNKLGPKCFHLIKQMATEALNML